MNLEDKVKEEQWEVLKQLKEESYRTVTGKTIEYWITLGFFGPGVISPENEIKALKKLEELGAIKIMNPEATPNYV